MWIFQPHLPQKNWWKHSSLWKQAKPQDQMIPTQISFYMQEMLQPSGCVSICLPVWKDVKSPKSGARQLSLPSWSLISPKTTLRATDPSQCCASHSSCLKGWSMDVSTTSLIPRYPTSKLASIKGDQPQTILLYLHRTLRTVEAKETASAVLVDLTIAYDTVWNRWLTLKLLRMLPDRHMVHFIVELISNRSFVLKTSDGQQSRLRRLKNGVPRNLSWPHCCSTSTSMTSLIPSSRNMPMLMTWPSKQPTGNRGRLKAP